MTDIPALSAAAQAFRPGIYRHFKGGLYEALCVGRSSEARDEEFVVYRSLEHGAVWIRPLAMFLENVDRDNYHGPRFTWVGIRKQIKFSAKLVALILRGEKTSTWRLFDDKNLSVGDEVDFVERDSLEQFATAKVTTVREKKIKEITESDYRGHEKFLDNDHMLAWYQQNYREPVDWDTSVKLIDFVLVEQPEIDHRS